MNRNDEIRAQCAKIRERCDAATKGPWEYDGMAFIWHDTEHGKQMILDTRGHGYLTGTLGLSEEQAAQIMDDNGKFAAAAREDLPWALDQIAELTAEVNRLTEAQRWIPVTERLPDAKEFTEYLIKIKGGHGVACKDENGFFRFITKGVNHPIEKAHFHSVTHWMPLPAAPEEGEREWRD